MPGFGCPSLTLEGDNTEAESDVSTAAEKGQKRYGILLKVRVK